MTTQTVSGLLTRHVSVFAGSTNVSPLETVPLADVLQRVQAGTYQQEITQLRHLLASGDTDRYTHQKRALMAFTPGGIFAQRAKNKLLTASGLLNFDFDHLTEVAEGKARLRDDPWVVYAFTSPSGEGLKVAVWGAGIVDDATYKHAWAAVLHYFERTYPDLAVSNDKACKDISRLCYVSWDPALYSNPDALLYAVPRYQPPAPKPKPGPQPTSTPLPADRRQWDAQQAIKTATEMIDASVPSTATTRGTRHETRLKASRLLGGYVAGGILTYGEAHAALQEVVERNTDDLSRSMQTIADGLHHGQQDAITPEDLEREYQAWKATQARLHVGSPLPTSNGTAPGTTTEWTWGSPPRAAPQAVIRYADTITEEAITWLWPPYVARKKVHVLDGDPGIGKTLWALQLAACVSRGYPLPDQLGKPTLPLGAPASVLLIAMEDGLGDTVIPRLKRAGADLGKIGIVQDVDDEGKPRPIVLSDLPLLAQHMAAQRPALVYIDAIQAVLGGKLDINRANQVTEILIPLRHFAEHYNAAIIFARHPAKPGQSVAKLIHRGMGSQAFMGTARLGLFVEEHPADPTKVLLVQSKSNAGGIGRTQIFSKRGGEFEWCGVTRVNKEMMAGSAKGPSPQAFLEACFWLEERLKDGRSYAAKDLQEEMKEEGLTHGVTFAAKKALGIVHTKTLAGTFTWHLPPLSLSTPSTPSTPSTSSTSSTSYSSTNTTAYEDQNGGVSPEEMVSGSPSHVFDVDDVDDVYDVDGVVTDPDCRHAPVDETSPGEACPQCRCTHLLVLGAYRKCPLCQWKGAVSESLQRKELA